MTDTAWQPTACILCECNCGIEVQLDGRTLTKVRGDKAHPASQGYTCEKALRLDRYQNGAHRLDSPLRREADGSFTPIDWDTAIVEISQRLNAVRDSHGGESIFFYGGGGQGNHLGGFFMRAAMVALGAKYRSNALAQEKTGEFWVDHHLYGGHTRGDFEHAEVSMFLGKNPWMSHGLPRARPTLREISRDPSRSMIVIDPRRTETADLADHHLALRPGTDAWCLAALCAVLVQEDLVDHEFLSTRTNGATQMLDVLKQIPVEEYSAHCGLSPDAVRAVARRIAAASSFSVFEDLGMQQAPHSTLSSYLNKLLWILVGSFGKRGGMAIHTDLVPLARADLGPDKRSPVLGAPVIAGLIPANIVAEEILTDHPARYRAMVVQSANPAHSVADTTQFREALAALELVICVDVAMTETGRLADYVLPAASQFEKPECTWFNFEFPHNGFHLRAPLMAPLPGTLPEAEIWSRVLDGLGALDGLDLDGLSQAAQAGRAEFADAFAAAAQADPRVAMYAPIVLYRTLGQALPEHCASGAALWTVAQRAAAVYPDSIRRAGHGTSTTSTGDLAIELFDAMVNGERGIVFSEDRPEDVWERVSTPDGRIHLVIPELLGELDTLAAGPHAGVNAEFPLVLAAGERRAFTANTIFRDPTWRRRDAHGGLRISPTDAAAAGLTDGDRAVLTTKTGRATVTIDVDDTMPIGAIALPNGLGLDEPGPDGSVARTGVAPNELTSASDRDPIVGTPWHKHVPARLEPVS